MTLYPAPGKLNLFLHVVGKRADGYHELQTVFRLVERADRVGVAVRADAEVRFSGIFEKDNLCLRAALLLKKHTATAQGCDLTLEKILPVGGGMGGGPWLDGRMRMAHAAIGYAASALESKTESYANVARITLDAISAYAEDVRASRQIKGGIPVKPAA